MNIRYRVTLSAEKRCDLLEMVQSGKVAARRMKRAQILLAADLRSTDEQIARNVSVGTSTVYRTKQQFVEEGLEAALGEASRPGAPRKLDVEDEAILRALACSKPPPGRARWSLQLLAGEMVRLTVHTKIFEETIRRRLGEMQLKPWQEKMWCIPKVDAEFVARMEDVLALYAERPDPRRPVVCFDETPRQLIGEERVPVKAEPGKRRRYDYEYVRNGTANVFMFVDANRSWRHAKVTDRRTCLDFAECLRAIERARQKLGAQLPQSRPTTGPGRRLNRSSSLGPGTRSAEQSVVWRIVWSTPVSRILWVPARPLIDLDVVEIDPHCVRAVVIDGIKCQYDVPPRP